MILCFFVSSATDLLQQFFGLPGFLFPCGFQSKTCLVTFMVDFRKVPYRDPFSFVSISCLMLFLSVLLVSSLILILCCILIMYLKHVWRCLVVVLVTLHVSGCCLGNSPCLRAVEQHTFHTGVADSGCISCWEGCCIPHSR